MNGSSRKIFNVFSYKINTAYRDWTNYWLDHRASVPLCGLAQRQAAMARAIKAMKVFLWRVDMLKGC